MKSDRISNWSALTYRIKCEPLENKKVRKQLESRTSCKFRQLPDVSRDIEKEWLLFKSAIISSAAERLRVAGNSEKKTPWWNQGYIEHRDCSLQRFQFFWWTTEGLF